MYILPKKRGKKKYSTKAEAKKAATKGRYPYKVKGGWSLSKKAKSTKRKTKRKTTKRKTTKRKTTKRKTTTTKRRRRRKPTVSPRSLLGVVEKKWHSKTKAAFNAHWAKNFASARSAEAFAQGIASVTGLSLKTIKASLPMKNFRAAQKNAGLYRNLALRKIDAAFRTKKWSRNYRRAFGGK